MLALEPTGASASGCVPWIWQSRSRGVVETLQIPLAGAGIAIQPHLLAQQAEEHDADAEGTREPGQVPRHAVSEAPRRQEPHEGDHPHRGRQEEVEREGVAVRAEEARSARITTSASST
jgi:hypothetical protein